MITNTTCMEKKMKAKEKRAIRSMNTFLLYSMLVMDEMVECHTQHMAKKMI